MLLFCLGLNKIRLLGFRMKIGPGPRSDNPTIAFVFLPLFSKLVHFHPEYQGNKLLAI